ncbi:transposase [Salimicrobium flavidum]|uniref:transposase n=1 Tax=Salimicrobium flavidum TaxID=570947 RepID=UPI000970E568|nr:transposase [Salimicrobium flavidum]
MNQSGKFKGQTTITKRRRKRLRSLLFQVARPLALHNEAFRKPREHYRHRAANPPYRKAVIRRSESLTRQNLLYLRDTGVCLQ